MEDNEEKPMRKTALATAMTVSPLVLGSSVRADDFSNNAPLTAGETVSRRSAIYTGTYALSGTWSGVSSPFKSTSILPLARLPLT
jgi:hypothetical protein